MSFTVVIKNNKNGKILFASEKTKALVFGAVAEKGPTVAPGVALSVCDTGRSDMALAIGLARRSIESAEGKDAGLKIMSLAAEAFLSTRGNNEHDKTDGV